MRHFARAGLMAVSLLTAGIAVAPAAQAQGYWGHPGWHGGGWGRPGWGGRGPGWGGGYHRHGYGPGAVIGGVLGGMALGAIGATALGGGGYYAPPPPPPPVYVQPRVVYAPPPVVTYPPPVVSYSPYPGY